MEPETKTERRLLTTVAAPSHTAGKSMNLTHISILIGLVMWGSLWGIPGAVLSVPLLGIQKILMSNACVQMPNCDRPTTVAYSCLFRPNLSGPATRVRMRGSSNHPIAKGWLALIRAHCVPYNVHTA